METTWIVTADEGRARIFEETDRTKALQEIETMVNPAARMRTSEKYTDDLGSTAAGKSSHNTGGALPSKQYEPPQTPEEHEAQVFAKGVTGFLLKGHQGARFQKLMLIAAPKFLGVLRAVLDPQLKPMVTEEINKNYTHSNAHRLREQLQAHFEKR